MWKSAISFATYLPRRPPNTTTPSKPPLPTPEHALRQTKHEIVRRVLTSHNAILRNVPSSTPTSSQTEHQSSTASDSIRRHIPSTVQRLPHTGQHAATKRSLSM